MPKRKLSRFFGNADVFATPKANSSHRRSIDNWLRPGDLILDSFAGSGTTAHAVLKQNAADGGKRKFILVEMEPGICKDITAERVRRVAGGYTNAKGEKVEGLGRRFPILPLEQGALVRCHGRGAGGCEIRAVGGVRVVCGDGHGFGRKANSPLLGVHEGVAVYLLYNGILKDQSADGGNVLTAPVLALLPPHDGPKVIYAAANRLGLPRLQREGIVFNKLPTPSTSKATVR